MDSLITKISQSISISSPDEVEIALDRLIQNTRDACHYQEFLQCLNSIIGNETRSSAMQAVSSENLVFTIEKLKSDCNLSRESLPPVLNQLQELSYQPHLQGVVRWALGKLVSMAAANQVASSAIA